MYIKNQKKFRLFIFSLILINLIFAWQYSLEKAYADYCCRLVCPGHVPESNNIYTCGYDASQQGASGGLCNPRSKGVSYYDCYDNNVGGGGGGCADYTNISDVGCYCDSSYSCDLNCFDGYSSYCGCDPECAAPEPTATPTPTPTPNPANFKVNSFYLTNSDGDKKYNYDENQNIYWHAEVVNNGQSTASTSNNRVYINLYQNREDDITTFTSSHTSTYIDTDDNWARDIERIFASVADGSRTSEFEGSEGKAFKRQGGQANNGEPLFARIMVDNDDAQNETPGSELTDNQRYFRYVIGDPDLAVTNFQLTDDDGNVRTTFELDANIFPKVTFENIGNATAISKDQNDLHTYSWFYKNEPNDVTTNTAGDTNVQMRNGEFGPATSYNYYCRPSPGSRCSAFTNQLAWDLSQKGTYTARVFLNYDHGALEVAYANNQATVEYSVGYTIAGRVYADMDQSSSYNSSIDKPLSGVTVTFSGPETKTATTNSSGNYTSPVLEPGTYSISANPGNDYNPLGTQPRSADFDARSDLNGQNLRFFPKYSISGNVFVDDDESKAKDGSESNYPANPGISVSAIPANAPTLGSSNIQNNADGTYTINGLISGEYTLEYPNLPTGYIMIHPQNGPPASFAATVGSSCSPASPVPGGTCSNGSISNLNFAIKGGQPWWQAYGFDVRFDNGVDNPIPPAPDDTCTGAFGLLPNGSSSNGMGFSGNAPADFWFGNGGTPNNWIVGGSAYPEVFSPSNGSIKTSYTYMQSVVTQSKITTKQLSSECNVNSCNLAGLANGVYVTTGNVTLASSTIPANRDIVILVGGTLTINGTVHVPTTSTLFFSVAGDINVSPTLGRTAACPAPAVGNGNIEGFFSTDGSFNTGSSANCQATPAVPDLQLNVQGAIVVDADSNDVGDFVNNRDLCTSNISFPSFMIKERPDFVLNAPEVMKVPNYIWREDAP